MARVDEETSEAAPPITPATACARSRSAMTSMSGSSLRSTPSSVRIVSPFAARRIADRPAGELVEVECVHRLAELEQDVVRDVDDRADRANAGRLQARRHPGGRGARRADIGDRRRVPRTQFGVFDGDRDSIGLPGGNGCRRPWQGRASGQVVRGRDFARQADHAQAVGAVGGDFEVDHRVAGAQRFDRRDLEPAQPERLGDFFGGALTSTKSRSHETTSRI